MPKNDAPKIPVEWLGFRSPPDFGAARGFGHLAGFLVQAVALAPLIGALALIFEFALALFQIGPYAPAEGDATQPCAASVFDPRLRWRAPDA